MIKRNDEHYYQTPYGIVPSSTTILQVLNKPALMGWAAKITADYLIKQWDVIDKSNLDGIYQDAKKHYKVVSQEAMSVGSIVHDCIAGWFKGEIGFEYLKESRVENSWNAFIQWTEENKVTALKIEHEVHSRHRYGGTLDLFADLKGELWVIDHKTSSGIFPEMELQVCSYHNALCEMGVYFDNNKEPLNVCKWPIMKKLSRKSVKVGILRLDKVTGMPEFHQVQDVPRKTKAFLKLTEFWHLMNPNYEEKLKGIAK